GEQRLLEARGAGEGTAVVLERPQQRVAADEAAHARRHAEKVGAAAAEKVHGAGDVEGHDGVVEGKRTVRPGGRAEEPTAVHPGGIPRDGAVVARRGGAALLDAPAEDGRRVAGKGAVADRQGALVSLVTEAAARARGEVARDGAADDGNIAVAGVADAPS